MNRLRVSIYIVSAIFLCANTNSTYGEEIARYDDGPFAGMGYPYSESARVGNLLFLAGQIGENDDGNLVPGGIQAEAEQMMLNIAAALDRRGLAMQDVVKCTVFLADIDEWAAFNEIYKFG